MSNALLLGYDLDQPSYRHRMRSLVGPLEAAGWQVRCERFPSGRYGVRTWERRGLLAWAHVAVLHQIKLSALEARLFAALSRRRIFDVDDAIYVRKPRHLGEAADDSVWRRRKFAATCRWVDAVAAGNEVLADAARPQARAIEILPTSIEASDYRPTTAGAGAARRPPSRAQGPGDLLRVSRLAGAPRRARRVERGHRGGIARRRAYWSHAPVR